MTDEMEEIYRDQCGKHVQFYDRTISSFYTPYGIQKLDTRYCNRIRAFQQGKTCTEYAWSYWSPYSNEPKREPRREIEHQWNDTYESIKKDIDEDPHLHPKIKENLLFNLSKV